MSSVVTNSVVIPNCEQYNPNMVQEEQDKHALNLGKLVSNFQSLEFVLRAFLSNNEIAAGNLSLKSINLDTISEGDLVPENAFTNYYSLVQLIGEYNNNPKVVSVGLTIAPALVEIRDAIAHGRVSSLSPSSPSRLLKFEKPRNGQTKVAFSVLMTKEWFGEQIKRVYEAILKVSEANKKLQNGTL